MNKWNYTSTFQYVFISCTGRILLSLCVVIILKRWNRTAGDLFWQTRTYYIHVTEHHNRFLFKKPIRRTNYPNLFCYKTLHVSGIFSAHHQEFSTVNSALVSFMKFSDDRFQAESGWNASSSWLCLETAIKNLHENYQCRMYSRKLLMMGREDARNMQSFITE